MSRIHFSALLMSFFGVLGHPILGKDADTDRLQAEKEREVLTQPKQAVPLLYGSEKSPVLATILNGYLYYSSAKQKGDCIGRGLYRFALAPEKRGEIAEETVLDPEKYDCISRITTDGNHLFLFIEFQKDNETQLGIRAMSDLDLRADRVLRDRFPAWAAEGLWLAHREEDRTQEPWNSQGSTSYPALTGVQSDGWMRRLVTNEKIPNKIGLESVSVSKANQARGLFRTNTRFEAQSRLYWQAGLTWDIAQNGYALLKPTEPNGFSQLLVLNLSKLEVRGIFGGETPDMDLETKLDKEGNRAVALRHAVAILPADYGVIIEDHTDYQNEWNALFYFPSEGSSVYRVQIPPEALEGMMGTSLYHKGYVISQPSEGRVIWYGQNTPFSVKTFPPRDLSLNTLSDTELKELSKQTGEKK